MRYTNYPEIIEFYTGIDRRRKDALEILIKDIREETDSVKKKCGLPEGLNPYPHYRWVASPVAQQRMLQEIANGVRESNLPATIKDQYADRFYDRSQPHDQTIRDVLTDRSFMRMMRAMKAGARALRNSDYVPPETKRELLAEILNCWEQASKVLLVLLPLLANEGYATYDGTGFILFGDFGAEPEERAQKILAETPVNVVSWCESDLFSKKMGTLLIDQLTNHKISDISKHELILLLIRNRPQNWRTQLQRYVASCGQNSFYLYDVHRILRDEYQYGYASPQTLRDMEHLIKMVITKHLTGRKDPGVNTIAKAIKTMRGTLLPPRDV